MIFKAFTYVKKAFANKGLNGNIEVVGDIKHPAKAIIDILNQLLKSIFILVFVKIVVFFVNFSSFGFLSFVQNSALVI